MIQDSGINWIRLDSRNQLINHYWDLLKEIDLYIHKHNDLEHATYWAVCRDNTTHNEIFCSNNTGKKITTPWTTIVKEFPELSNIQRKLNLHAYIGRTMAGNWGIHRHCYAPDSAWNIAIFDSGSSNGHVDFYKTSTSNLNPCTEYFEDEVDLDCEGFKLWESVPIMTGDILSINTWAWHSHTTQNRNVCAFLSCLQNTPPDSRTRSSIRRTLRHL